MLLGRPWQMGNFITVKEKADGTYLEFPDPKNIEKTKYEFLACPRMSSPELDATLGILSRPSNISCYSIAAGEPEFRTHQDGNSATRVLRATDSAELLERAQECESSNFEPNQETPSVSTGPAQFTSKQDDLPQNENAREILPPTTGSNRILDNRIGKASVFKEDDSPNIFSHPTLDQPPPPRRTLRRRPHFPTRMPIPLISNPANPRHAIERDRDRPDIAPAGGMSIFENPNAPIEDVLDEYVRQRARTSNPRLSPAMIICSDGRSISNGRDSQGRLRARGVGRDGAVVIENPETRIPEVHRCWGVGWFAYLSPPLADDPVLTSNAPTAPVPPLSTDAEELMNDFITNYPTDSSSPDPCSTSSSSFEMQDVYNGPAVSPFGTACSDPLAALDLGSADTPIEIRRRQTTRPTPLLPEAPPMDFSDATLADEDDDMPELQSVSSYEPGEMSEDSDSSTSSESDYTYDDEDSFITGRHDMPLPRGARLLSRFCPRDPDSDDFYNGIPACYICEEPKPDCYHTTLPPTTDNVYTVGDEWVHAYLHAVLSLGDKQREKDFRQAQAGYRRHGNSSISTASPILDGARPSGPPHSSQPNGWSTPSRHAHSSNKHPDTPRPTTPDSPDPFEARFDIPSRRTQALSLRGCFGTLDQPLLVNFPFFSPPQPRRLAPPKNEREKVRRCGQLTYWILQVNGVRTMRSQIEVLLFRIAFTIVAREWGIFDKVERNIMARLNREFRLSATALRNHYTFPYGCPFLHDDEASFLYYAMLIFRMHKRPSIAFDIERLLRLEFTDSRPVRYLLRAGFLDRRSNGRYDDINLIYQQHPESCPW
ncbi:hypothetical protein PLICRDRAFT_175056 [Plicaturopsis crispa FD-325 SS-3]|nr:hypothetical protein PLICRDRAFT_175056 [Plicaturopsis crispa FD-325 SS-3]